MATAKFFLDKRRVKKGSPSVLKVAICHHAKTSYISTSVKLLPNQWDESKSKVVHHPEEKLLNLYLSGVMQKVQRTFLILAEDGHLTSMSSIEIKECIEAKLNPEKAEKKQQENERKKLFAVRFVNFAKSKKTSTQGVYMHTLSRMKAFAGAKFDRLTFEDITKEWLTSFDAYLAQTAPSKNARNIHLRNIRAVFNEAIDDEITTFYPFRRFKIRPVPTAKRNLKVEDLRKLFNYKGEEYQQQYIDMFKLIFMLVGINMVDLCHLKEIADGRITYHRAKTGALLSIKVEPEALEIIERYRGIDWLINILDRYKDHRNYIHRMNNTLKKIGPTKREGRGGKKKIDALFPNLSTYWARHSWATIAASLDIPKETIGHALGHSANSVTDIYIEFDQRKVDKANRKVLDWVLYGKK